MPSGERTNSCTGLALRILDGLRFINHHIVKLSIAERLKIANQYGIAGDDDFEAVEFSQGTVSLGTGVHQTANLWRKLLELALPIRQQALGRHDQRWHVHAAAVLLSRQQRNGLQRL